MNNLKIHHIGYLVKRIDKSIDRFAMMGYKAISELTRDEYRGVDIIFMEKDGYVIELVCPFSKDSVTAGLMKTHRNSPYHMCYEVDDIDEALLEFAQLGYVKMDEPAEAVAIEGRRVCFMMDARVGMIELLEGRIE